MAGLALLPLETHPLVYSLWLMRKVFDLRACRSDSPPSNSDTSVSMQTSRSHEQDQLPTPSLFTPWLMSTAGGACASSTSLSQALGTQQAGNSNMPGIRETIGVDLLASHFREERSWILFCDRHSHIADKCSLTTTTCARRSAGCRGFW